VLELALREALSRDDDYVGTEHLLLGLVGKPDCVAMQVLQAFGVSPEATRSETIRVIREPPSDEQVRRSRSAKSRRALENAAASVAAAKELAIANEEFDQAAQISEIERRLSVLLKQGA
jgi:ATP-dependent Clp protease ATP-binding subunit ClpA